jgi:hypothetical protein
MFRLRIALLSLGALAGFGSEALMSAHCRTGWHDSHRESFERRVAAVCVDAARGAR